VKGRRKKEEGNGENGGEVGRVGDGKREGWTFGYGV
jgi:hypothetical protein